MRGHNKETNDFLCGRVNVLEPMGKEERRAEQGPGEVHTAGFNRRQGLGRGRYEQSRKEEGAGEGDTRARVSQAGGTAAGPAWETGGSRGAGGAARRSGLLGW